MIPKRKPLAEDTLISCQWIKMPLFLDSSPGSFDASRETTWRHSTTSGSTAATKSVDDSSLSIELDPLRHTFPLWSPKAWIFRSARVRG